MLADPDLYGLDAGAGGRVGLRPPQVVQTVMAMLHNLNHKWCPQPDFHRQPDAQDASALCFEPWGQKGKPLAGLFHPVNHPTKRPQSCFAVRGSRMVRASGNAPDPGTDLVRCGV